MDLQYVLLLIGTVIVAVIAFNALDKARLMRHLRRGAAVLRPRIAARAPLSGLNINPPPTATSDKRHLSPDAATAARPKTPEQTLRAELETIEEMATMPLRLRTVSEERTREAKPDERLDFILNLPGELEAPRNLALGIFKQHEYELEKPRKLFGQRHRSGLWTELARDPEHTLYGELALAIQMGLLGTPEMQIAGNGSDASVLRWYQDRSSPLLPRPWVFSVSLWAYRGAMLAWSLWVAQALLGWLRWGFRQWSAGGTWARLRTPRVAAR